MEVIYEYRDYKIILEEKPNKTAIQLLHTTLWGTNGPIFEHLDTAEKVDHLSKSLAFSLEKNGRTIGTCTVLEREITVEGKKYRTWYGRYFTIDKQYQGSIFGGILLKYIKAHMESISNLPTIFYVYVDQANPRSSKLLKYIGFEIIFLKYPKIRRLDQLILQSARTTYLMHNLRLIYYQHQQSTN